ncbi:hypothetical protein CHH80_03415 [Bacillus sp. 7504-2]|nr:hypothetical protein CHH80_03415 [Bacillus sp. 7504-2]
MPLQNVFEIDVDIKSKTAIRTPTVTQNDAVVFIFRVFDEGRIYNIEDGSTFTMTSTRPDKQAVITVGEVTGINTIRFKLGTTELEVKGKVEAVIQVYDADGRVSTIPFRYEVLSDPSGDYIPSEDEETLIQKVLGEGPKILADAQQATTEANEAAEAANTATDKANQIAAEVSQAISDARQATQDALDITEIATFAEQVRVEAESERQQNEADRVQAETSRQEAEHVRQQQEAQRQSATQTAISNAEQATEGAQAVADNTRYIEPYNEATEYKKNNVVRYGKNSYIALQDTQGNAPNASGDSEYWGLLAVGGVDGTGLVSSVNGVWPDESGDVELDFSAFATKQELHTLNEGLSDNINEVRDSLGTHVSDYISHTGFAATTGTSNNYTATLEPALSAYAEGVSLRIKIHEENTDVATINVNELGEVPIKKADGSDVDSGQLKQDSVYTISFNGSNFILQGEGGGLNNLDRSSLIASVNGILGV